MIELLVRIKDKIHDDPKLDVKLTKRGDVIAWHFEGQDWGIEELNNPEWRIIKANISEDEANTLISIERPPDEVKDYQLLRKRAVSLDLDTLGVDAADTKKRDDNKQPVLTTKNVEDTKIIKQKIPEPDAPDKPLVAVVAIDDVINGIK